jgi:Acetyltransferase (GNAT) family
MWAGVGRRMVEHSLQRACERGFKAIQFNFVVSTNERAVRLYKDFRLRHNRDCSSRFLASKARLRGCTGDVQNPLTTARAEVLDGHDFLGGTAYVDDTLATCPLRVIRGHVGLHEKASTCG